MIDKYLKFASEDEAKDVLYTKVVTEWVGDHNDIPSAWIYEPNYKNIDTLGILYAPFVEGEEPVAIEGWHVNVRVVGDEAAAPLEAYAVVPALPRRIWG